MKIKNQNFGYFFIAFAIILIFTIGLFIAFFELSSLDKDNEIFDDKDVKIVKLNKNRFKHFDKVNEFLKTYYHYGLNQFTSELVDNQEQFELKAIKESNYFYIDENTSTIKKGNFEY